LELKKELIGLGRSSAGPGAAWDLEGADLEAFVRISPAVRAIDLDSVRNKNGQGVLSAEFSPNPLAAIAGRSVDQPER
jgi:hypothetical protein